MEADFSGWATKSGLVCSDGKTILAHAFKDQDKMRVPLVYQHQHQDPGNLIGHAILENRPDGVYTYCYLNETPNGKIIKEAVRHQDVEALSIYANQLVMKGLQVMHGVIREVSVVLAGANPGAFIDQINLAHGDGYEELVDEGVIYTGERVHLEHADPDDDPDDNDDDDPDDDDETLEDIYNTLSDKQKKAVNFIVQQVASDNVKHGDEDDESDDPDEGDADEDDLQHEDQSDNTDETLKHQEGEPMARNIFEQVDNKIGKTVKSLSHDQLSTIVKDAEKIGSLRESFIAHADEYGIENIDFLFPDAKLTSTSPEFIKRRTEWVQKVLSGTNHSPLSRIKTILADITAEEARARGYVKGNLKKDEIISLLKRTTTPTTIYKKQKLDRDDILDITEIDVIVWLKAEMRLMLDEELARAILIGDGRSAASEDKIKDPAGALDGQGIRSIYLDHSMYAPKTTIASNTDVTATIEQLIRARTGYKGSGTPDFYTTLPFITDMLLAKDKIGRRLYNTKADLAAALMVNEIVDVEVMETIPSLVGIFVNLSDYKVGADKGGVLSMFDDFDIDYNQQKYLLETRVSGALTKPASALVIQRNAGTAATPVSPSFNGETNTITIPTTTGITYQIDSEAVTGNVVITEDIEVVAVANANYYIPAGTVTSWSFVFTPAG